MAREKTMLAASVCGSDGFLELSFEAQALYVQLCLNADGSGVVDCRKKVARYMGASEGAYVELVDAGFVLPMADGSLCVVADWWVCNSFDRYHYYPGGHYAELVRDFDLSEPMRDGNARPRYVSAGEGVASSGFLVKASRRGTTGDGTGARTGEHTSKGEQRNGEQRNQLNGTEGEQGSGGLGERDGFSAPQSIPDTGEVISFLERNGSVDADVIDRVAESFMSDCEAFGWNVIPDGDPLCRSWQAVLVGYVSNGCSLR